MDPLPKLDSCNLSRGGIFHEIIKGNASITRDPCCGIRQCTAEYPCITMGTMYHKHRAYAETFDLTPSSVILPLTLVSRRSAAVTLTSSRRT